MTEFKVKIFADFQLFLHFSVYASGVFVNIMNFYEFFSNFMLHACTVEMIEFRNKKKYSN